ncbi:MAG: peptidylprolyl isomerase [Gammaproteobacteria bacterium]
MRALPLLLFVASFLASSGVRAQETLSNTGVLLDRIVAVVNDGVILQSQMDSKVDLVAGQLRDQNTALPPRQVLESQVLEQLITQEVQLQRARRLGVRVPDAMLNSTLQRVAQRNGISLSDLPRAMAAQGIDYRQYREDMRNEMILDSLRQRDVVARISVSEREIARFLGKQESSAGDQIDYELSHLLISVESTATPEQVAEAGERVEQLYQRLVAGEDFAQLAVEYSEGQNALDGGDLGWRKGAQLPPVFFDAIDDLQPGEFTDPIRSPSGFHLLKLNDVRGAEKIIVLQTRVSHILLQPNEVLDETAVEQKLLQLRGRIEDGEEFTDVARIESEDPGSAPLGGDLGWTSPGTFVPVFEDQLARLEPGQMSMPFRTEFGWHLVLLVDRQERDTTEEVKRQRAIQAIRASKQEQETEIWLRELRDEAYVEVRG